jgi:hydrogenase/urease accessory protein HupE
LNVRFCLAAAATLLPRPALAHATVEGMEGLYVGFLHPFSTSGSLLALVAFGLLMARNRQHLQFTWIAFIAASAVTIAGLILSGLAFDPQLALLALALVLALAAASGIALPKPALVPAAGLAGIFGGVAWMPDPGPTLSMFITAFGAIVGANLLLSYVGGGLGELQKRYTQPWIAIGVRVMASWVAAIAVLLGALLLKTGS